MLYRTRLLDRDRRDPSRRRSSRGTVAGCGGFAANARNRNPAALTRYGCTGKSKTRTDRRRSRRTRSLLAKLRQAEKPVPLATNFTNFTNRKLYGSFV